MPPDSCPATFEQFSEHCLCGGEFRDVPLDFSKARSKEILWCTLSVMSFFEPQTEPRALFSLETCLRKSHKAPLRNSPLHTDSAQKIVPTLPNMNRVRRQKLRPKILRPDNGPAHFPVRSCERRRGHRSQRGMRPGRLWSHRGAEGKG